MRKLVKIEAIVIIVCFVLVGCGPGFVKAPTPPVEPSPTPGLDANIIIAQALATSVGAGTYASLADTDEAHPTPTLDPTPAPSDAERVAGQVAWPLFGIVCVSGVVIIGLSAIVFLHVVEKRKADDRRAQAALEAAERQIERMQARQDRAVQAGQSSVE